MSAFGRGQPWGGTVYDAFPPCLAAVAGFYVSHWEKYITGVLYLPWLYDIVWLVSANITLVSILPRVLLRHSGREPHFQTHIKKVR